MRVVVQRVNEASVRVDERTVGKIAHGLLLLVGVKKGDSEVEADYCANKIAGLRIFEDQEQKMNLSVVDAAGEILSVSQFTLYGDTRHGRRPSFVEAAPPEEAEPLYEYFNKALRSKGLNVATGVFGADMDVALTNDGPVTLIVEK
ncbi:D-tyrosyl-tRNA(Tyr) deacylase [Pullulanibacillus pueri]|uniref:D-aminoacyl-tRNA deacylase n=1 Tax=Pullulanibacillus pueri TaxID=1437324 RepID=A0A8J2ZXU9_9BACL|nr:D-aminoacyl-tRNA deacylase [Pullulanibacillus pueri]MBM7683259.1 D-tyrosyl-tRNA(Tyr) deacylase [Pullulanibacillus pueri]GGH85759.1 D-aminoacyl-tRNA deacylase [Pullulanibacillus pueri]